MRATKNEPLRPACHHHDHGDDDRRSVPRRLTVMVLSSQVVGMRRIRRRRREPFLRKGIAFSVFVGSVFWATQLNWFLPRWLEANEVYAPQAYSFLPLSKSSIATSDEEEGNLNVNVDVVDTHDSHRSSEWYSMMEFVNRNNKECAGKEHLLEILSRAGKTLSIADCERLPYWSEVVSLYGEKPIVYGMNTCKAYRDSLFWEGLPIEADPRIAGLFNTGTNILAELVRLNIHPVDRKQDLHAPNGKHTPLLNKSWYRNRSQSPQDSTPLIPFPIVIVRDPFRWMNSMCKRPYIATWPPRLDGRCPNLVPSDEERDDPAYANLTTFPVTVPHPVEEHYESLAEMWSTFYRQYLESDVPRLIVRYEDILFHAETVAGLVSKCLGRPVTAHFKYPWKPGKTTTDHVDFMEALVKYGREEGRYGSLTDDDRDYAQNAFEPALMNMFHYPNAPRPREQLIRERIDSLVAASSSCLGKEKLIEILLRAGAAEVSAPVCDQLPSWSDVRRLYGEEPIVHGLETCRAYRQSRMTNNGTLPIKIRVGGQHNTGTNAFVDSLMLNFGKLGKRLDYNMPGWKHDSLSTRRFKNNKLTSDIFPVIIVRDPLRWMQSMCKIRYELGWMDGEPGHCPNLVPSPSERMNDRYENVTTFEVRELGRVVDARYPSLADMWSKWNREYFDATFPRLLIRFEDTLFHGEKVMKIITECVGQPLKMRYRYQLDNAKPTKESSDFISALRTYGKENGRYDGYEPDDLKYASEVLDKGLMKSFHYPPVPSVIEEQEMNRSISGISDSRSSCRGKERLVQILHRAGVAEINETLCDSLPFWSEVEQLYGEEPVIIGLDTCKAYRDSVKRMGGLPVPRVGGLFNSGTNAFVDLLMMNFGALADRLDYNIMLGKHSSLKFKMRNNSNWLSPDVLPIILVRDPFRWMASMCRVPYKLIWTRGRAGHCPNLVPSALEQSLGLYKNVTTFGVRIRDQADEYDSLADMWSSWYQQYVSSNFPKLIIRFEDTLFHVEKVIRAVSDCLGDTKTSEVRYSLNKAKDISQSSDFITALVRYGREEGRYDGMSLQDRNYARKALNPGLMKKFGYAPLPSAEDEFVDVRISRLVSEFVTCQGKERLLAILLRTGRDDISFDDCAMLPRWDEVASLYGDEPVVIGLETCGRFRSNVQEWNRTGKLIEPLVRVAGLFNTGTNALTQSLALNTKDFDGAFDLQAGKHVPPKAIWKSTFAVEMEKRLRVLPVVLVRDPFRWMQSMCKTGYNARWVKGLDGRCPNLVPNENEERLVLYQNMTTFNVNVSMKNMRFFDQYESLADLWSTWNRLYYDYEYPRLIVRFEDMLFHAEAVMKQIFDCAGIPMQGPFLYQMESSKKDKKTADFITGLSKYGRRFGRYDSLFPRDIEYLREVLDPELLQAFHYPGLGPSFSSSAQTTSDA